MNEPQGMAYHQRVRSDLSQGFALDDYSLMDLFLYQPTIA